MKVCILKMQLYQTPAEGAFPLFVCWGPGQNKAYVWHMCREENLATNRIRTSLVNVVVSTRVWAGVLKHAQMKQNTT